MTTTMNGWPYATAKQVTPIGAVKGGDTADVLKGDVATVFQWFIDQFHANVEKVVTCNGHRTAAQNAEAQGAARSNHISGTAIDLNGGRHPYEPKIKGRWYSGFTPVQENRIRKLLHEAGGVIYWGRDFPPGLRDAMHFEIRGTAGQVAVLARKLRAAQVVIPTPPAKPEPSPDVPKILKERRTMFIYRYGSTRYRMLTGDRVVGISRETFEILRKTDRVSLIEKLPNTVCAEWDLLFRFEGLDEDKEDAK